MARSPWEKDPFSTQPGLIRSKGHDPIGFDSFDFNQIRDRALSLSLGESGLANPALQQVFCQYIMIGKDEHNPGWRPDELTPYLQGCDTWLQ